MKTKSVIGFSMGDPHGVGPEVLLKALSYNSLRSRLIPLIVGDFSYLRFVEKKVLPRKFRNSFRLFSLSQSEVIDFKRLDPNPKNIWVYDLKNIRLRNIRFGKVNADAGFVSGVYIKEAVSLALKNKIKALVTAPINKESFLAGGWGEKFIGHTEMLANLCGVQDFALMLMTGQLKAVHVTSHIPLKNISRQIKAEKIISKIKLINNFFSKRSNKKVKIAVSGLNPHAGDGGILGGEEIKEIIPAISFCQRNGIDVEGPFSPDVIWPLVLNQKFDVGLAMYHDQGQIAVKLLGAINNNSKGPAGVNLTLGLPFIRTSPAHGTAFNIAGKGIASELSMKEAIEAAVFYEKK
ncbi:MAG: 4-hydroxythreonine-4-phosphate dehydrogenase PdxA [Elusimicrobiota bacterium]